MTARTLLFIICIYVVSGSSHCASKADCHPEEEDDDIVQVDVDQMGEISGTNTTVQQILTSLARAQLSARQHRKGLTLATKGLSRLLPPSLRRGGSPEELAPVRERMTNIMQAMYPEGAVRIAEAAKPRAQRRLEGKSDSKSTEPEGLELLETTKLALVTYHSDDDGWSWMESPWPLVAHYVVKGKYSSRDMVMLHEKDGRCVITFEGSDDIMDFINNFHFTHQVVACGGKILRGFWEELNAILAARDWEEKFIPILTSHRCSSIYTAGHSLGGALAEIVATCANHNQLHRVARNAKTKFTVDKVFSTGAPAISTTPISNPLHPSGCFDGVRAFILDTWHYDVVAACTGLVGFQHPYITPMEIQDTMSNGNYSMTTWDCHGHEALWEPTQLKNDVKVGPVDVPLPKLPDIEVHLPGAYIERLKYIYNLE